MKYLFSLLVLFTSLLTTSFKVYAQDRILIVVTNNKEVQATIAGKDTTIAGGYTLSEVSQAFDVFSKSGFKVDFMSPKGGETFYEPEEHLTDFDKAFLHNDEVMQQLSNTFSPDEVDAKEYDAIYFAGGKTMWDFPDNKTMANLTAAIYENNGVIGAVCHGPAALLNVRLSDGERLIDGLKVSSFTNMEEQLFSKTGKFLPYMLQDELTRLGAHYQEAPPMFDQAVVDGRVVTGQNPLSTYSVAEHMVNLMGKTIPERPLDAMSFTIGIVQKVVQNDKSEALAFAEAHAADLLLNERLLAEVSIYGSRGYMGSEVQNHGIPLLEVSSELIPNDPQIFEELARHHYNNGDLVKAKQFLTESLNIDPDSETANALKNEMDSQ